MAKKFNLSRDIFKKIIDKKIIIEVGTGMSSVHTSSYYKDYTELELKKLLDIDIIDNSKFFTLNQLAKKIGIDFNIFKKRIAKSKFKPVGIGLAKNEGLKELKLHWVKLHIFRLFGYLNFQLKL